MSSVCLTSWSRVTSLIGATTIYEKIYDWFYPRTYTDTDYGATSGYSPQIYDPVSTDTWATGCVGSYCGGWASR